MRILSHVIYSPITWTWVNIYSRFVVVVFLPTHKHNTCCCLNFMLKGTVFTSFFFFLFFFDFQTSSSFPNLSVRTKPVICAAWPEVSPSVCGSVCVYYACWWAAPTVTQTVFVCVQRPPTSRVLLLWGISCPCAPVCVCVWWNEVLLSAQCAFVSVVSWCPRWQFVVKSAVWA